MLGVEITSCCETPSQTDDTSIRLSHNSRVARIKKSAPSVPERRSILIEFLYIDLDQCKRCQGARNNLEEAIFDISKLFDEIGVNVKVKRVHVQTEEEARNLGLISSPTIRLNGRDIQPDVKESLCESCCEVAGEDVNCRVWTYQGQEYSAPPKAMIIDAILRGVYCENMKSSEIPPREYDVPDNLKRFFAGKRKKP
jgi:hypothetical protein